MATDTETKREVMELPVTPTPTYNQVLLDKKDRHNYFLAEPTWDVSNFIVAPMAGELTKHDSLRRVA